jgi:hypothetical protein
MNIDDKTASRLKADRTRFIERQHERLKQIGVQAAFTVNAVHVRVTNSKGYEDRHNPAILYGEWTVSEKPARSS